MDKRQKPEEIFSEIIEDYKKIYGDDLISIILYGSGAGNDYNPGKSDVNFLMILSEAAIDQLDRAIKTVSKWKKKKVATPLIMTKTYINSSLDAYPLEFLNMKQNHILVFGEDVLKNISFEAQHLRLQCEREIKGKLLLLREGFLETNEKEKKIKELIKASITAFLSIFNGILYLKNVTGPSNRREIIQSVAKEIPIDQEIFIKCLNIKEGKGKVPSSEIKEIFNAYLIEARKLWEFVDKMEIKNKEM